jgi:hypothetical protein
MSFYISLGYSFIYVGPLYLMQHFRVFSDGSSESQLPVKTNVDSKRVSTLRISSFELSLDSYVATALFSEQIMSVMIASGTASRMVSRLRIERVKSGGCGHS